MGIFDNVNWQQALPGALMGFAGAMDPNSGKMLAESGWNAVANYMKQQQMQQQKDEFQERMKQLDKEMGLREKYLGIAEQKSAQERDELLQKTFINEQLPGILSKWESDPDYNLSKVVGDLNTAAKERGIKLNSDYVTRLANDTQLFKTSEGTVSIRHDEKTGDLHIGQLVKRGKNEIFEEFNWAKGVPAKALDQLASSPGALMAAKRAATAKGHTAVAQLMQDKMDELGTKDIATARVLFQDAKAEHAAWDKQWNIDHPKNPLSGEYVEVEDKLGPPPKDPKSKEYAQWKADRGTLTESLDNEYKATKGKQAKEVKPLRDLLNKSIGLTPKELDAGAGKVAAGVGYDRWVKAKTPEEKAEIEKVYTEYRGLAEQVLGDKETKEKKIAWARAATDAYFTSREGAVNRERRRRPMPGGTPAAIPPAGANIPYAQQMAVWGANPAQPMPGPAINPAPSAVPMDYQEQLRKEAIRKQMFGHMGMF
jgi:hypothetical protein